MSNVQNASFVHSSSFQDPACYFLTDVLTDDQQQDVR